MFLNNKNNQFSLKRSICTVQNGMFIIYLGNEYIFTKGIHSVPKEQCPGLISFNSYNFMFILQAKQKIV